MGSWTVFVQRVANAPLANHTDTIWRYLEHLRNRRGSRFPDRPECVVKEGSADSCRLNYGR